MYIDQARGVAPEFRQDVNGLRAIAVVAVTLFHFKVSGFSGGFVGVDVFFVISGFLMTGIILRGLTGQGFSVSRFYWARFTRIYPPMLVLLVAVFAMGYRFLAPEEYAALARRTIASIFSVANFTFYRETSDYFAQSSSANWLLHLWSLAVECQFYLAFPLLLMATHRTARRLWIGISIAFVASLTASIWLTGINQPAAFYMMPPRAWEFLAGAIAYLAIPSIHPRFRLPLSLFGVSIIAVSITVFSEATAFPGVAATIPVAGTAMVLAAPAGNLLLTNRLSSFLGDISYSLYLWHWPVWLAAMHLDITPTLASAIVCLMLSVSLAVASHRMVEIPSRHLRQPARMAAKLGGLISGGALISVAAVLVIISDGMPSRAPEIVREAIPRFHAETAKLPGHCYLMPNETPDRLRGDCFKPGADRPAIMVWGDSYAKGILYGFAADPSIQSDGLAWMSSASCPPLLSPPSELSSTCPAIANVSLESIKAAQPNRTVLFARWSYYEQNGIDVVSQLRAVTQQLQEAGTKVVLVGPVPEWFPTLPQKLLMISFSKGSIPQRLVDPSHQGDADLDRRLAALATEVGAAYVSIFDLWCTSEGCLPIVGPEGKEDIAVYDHGHMTLTAAKEVVRRGFQITDLPRNSLTQ